MRDHRYNSDRDKKGRDSKKVMVKMKSDRHTCPICGGDRRKDERICIDCADRSVVN
jgi:hypothetical protein